MEYFFVVVGLLRSLPWDAPGDHERKKINLRPKLSSIHDDGDGRQEQHAEMRTQTWSNVSDTSPFVNSIAILPWQKFSPSQHPPKAGAQGNG